MKDYIEQALRTKSPLTVELIDRLGNKADEVHAIMGLLTEVGELTDSFKRHVYYGTEIDTIHTEEEIGDILWYLAVLMNAVGTTFERCMQKNIRKLTSRYPLMFNEMNAVQRDLNTERSVLET